MPNTVSYTIRFKDQFSQISNKLNNNLKGIDNKVKALSKRLNKIGSGMKSLGRTMSVSVTAPIVALGTASVFSFSKLEKGLTNTLTLLNKGQIKKFSKELEGAQKGAIKMGFSIEDTNKALFDTVSALGISSKSVDIFRAAQELAIAGDAKLGDAVLGISKVMNVYGKAVTDAEFVSESLFTAQKAGTTNVASLAQNIPKVAGGAKLAGMGIAEMASTLAVLTNVMANTEEASTAMSAIIRAVTTPGEQAIAIFKEMGITYGIANVKQAGFANVLKQVADALKKNEDAVAAAIPEIRAMKGITNLTDESLQLMNDTVIQINKNYKDGTGKTAAFNQQMSIMDQQIKKATGSMTLASQKIGIVLAPFVLKAANAITMLADRFSKLSPSLQKTIILITGIVAVVGPLLIFFGMIAAAVAAIGGIPILIGAAIAGVVALFVVLQKKFQIFTKIWDFLKTPMGMVTIVLAAIGVIPIAIGGAIALVGALFVGLQKKFQIFTKLGGFLKKMWNLSKLASPGFSGGKVNVNNLSEFNNSIDQPTPSPQSVDVSGAITVAAEKGSKIVSTLSNQATLGSGGPILQAI